MDSFDCVQVSIRHKDVKKYLKENKIHRMSNDHHPELLTGITALNEISSCLCEYGKVIMEEEKK